MDDAHMASKRIIARKGLFFSAQMASDFLLAYVVDGVFVAGEIIRSGEDGVAWFARGRIDALAPVRTCLAVAVVDVCGIIALWA